MGNGQNPRGYNPRIHEMLNRRGLWAVLSVEQGLTNLLLLLEPLLLCLTVQRTKCEQVRLEWLEIWCFADIKARLADQSLIKPLHQNRNALYEKHVCRRSTDAVVEWPPTTFKKSNAEECVAR